MDIRIEQRRLWNQIVDLLSLAQYSRTMGGDMTWAGKARQALQVSKSKKVRALANQILELETAYANVVDLDAYRARRAS